MEGLNIRFKLHCVTVDIGMDNEVKIVDGTPCKYMCPGSIPFVNFYGLYKEEYAFNPDFHKTLPPGTLLLFLKNSGFSPLKEE